MKVFRYIFFVIYLTAVFSYTSYGGSVADTLSAADSLRTFLHSASYYENSNPQKSLAANLNALRLANRTGKLDKKVRILNNIIKYYQSINNTELAAEYVAEKVKTYKSILLIKKGATKIPVLLFLGEKEKAADYDSSIYYNNEALELSRKHGLIKYQGQANENLGNIYFSAGNRPVALTYFYDALKAFNSIRDSLSAAGVYWRIGKIYFSFHLYKQALEYLTKSKNIAEKIHSKDWIYNSLRKITSIYYSIEDTIKAKIYFQKLITLARQNGDYQIISLAYHTLGKYYYSKKEYRKAAFNFDKAVKLRRKNKEPLDRLILSCENLAESYIKLNKNNDALKVLNKANALCIKADDPVLTSKIEKQTGIVYRNLKDYNKAIFYLKKSITAVSSIKYNQNSTSGYKSLSELYFNMNNYREAYSYLNKYMMLQDSLWADHYNDGVSQLRDIYISEKNAKEFQMMQTRSKNELLIAMIIIFFMSLITLLVLYSRYRYKVHSEDLLKNKADEISKALLEVSKLNEVLKISETTYRYLFERNPLPMIIWDKNSKKILSANFAAEALYGYSLEEFSQMNILDIFDEEDRRKKKDLSPDHKYPEKISDIKHLKKDGDVIDVEMVIHPLIFEGQKAFNAMIKDVTAKKYVENAIIESEQRLNRAQKIAHVGNWEIDLKTLNVWASEEAFMIYGFDKSQYGYVNYKEIKPIPLEEDRDMLERAMSDLLNGKKEYNVEFRIRKKDSGELRYVGSNAEVIKNEKGEPVKVIGVIRDITEIKIYQKELIEAKERAERSDKLKSDFLAQMSHEIRSPVNTILSFASLLKEELSGNINEDMNVCFNSIDSGGRRLIRTIDLILNTADIQSGRYEPFNEEIDLGNEIIKNLMMEFASAVKAKKLKFSYTDNLGGRKIKLDKYTVTQIFANLIDNSIKYTKKGSINIELTGTKEEIFVKIIDTGIGISKEYLPYLFDPFSQEEQGYTRRFEGTGLGLSLVKKYCDLNNARIKVESEKGKGSTFIIVFSVESPSKADKKKTL